MELKASVARQWRRRLFWEAGLTQDDGRGRNGSRGACSYSVRRGRSPHRWPAGEISAPASVRLLRAAQGRESDRWHPPVSLMRNQVDAWGESDVSGPLVGD
jgi:hypothetical protein